MAKEIQTGIEQLKQNAPSQRQIHERAWHDLRNKLDSLLIGNRALKSNEIQQLCQEMDQMSLDQRSDHINMHWGVQYANKAVPILHQLQIVENEIAKYLDEHGK